MITRNLVEGYLHGSLGDPKYSQQGLKFCCPKCDVGKKYNLEINMSNASAGGGIFFNCWSCKYSGPLRRLFQDYAADTSWEAMPEFKRQSEIDEVEVKPINYPKDTVPFYLNKEVTHYLVNVRGIDKKELIRRKVAYVYSDNEVYHDHICFPFYENGRLVGACLQNFKTKKYRNLGKLNFTPYKEFLNDKYPITITEGCYDALSSVNAVPLLSTDINDSIMKYVIDKDVILATDNTVELSLYMSNLKKLEESNVRSLVLFDLYSYKDMNEFYTMDRNKFFKEYRSCFNKIKK